MAHAQAAKGEASPLQRVSGTGSDSNLLRQHPDLETAVAMLVLPASSEPPTRARTDGSWTRADISALLEVIMALRMACDPTKAGQEAHAVRVRPPAATLSVTPSRRST